MCFKIYVSTLACLFIGLYEYCVRYVEPFKLFLVLQP